MPWLNFFRGRHNTFEVSFCNIHFKIAKMYWNSEFRCLVHISFLEEALKLHFLKEIAQKSFVFRFEASFWKEVSQKRYVFDLQCFIFEGSLAQKLRF